jgi:hypothetical protein
MSAKLLISCYILPIYSVFTIKHISKYKIRKKKHSNTLLYNKDKYDILLQINLMMEVQVMVKQQQKLKQAQAYDNTLKVLFGEEAAEILPRLMPGTKLLEEKNIELDRSQLKADLVYTVKYKGRLHIVNVELQTKADKYMHYRLLQYHVGLHAKYKLPVLSVVLYPFAKSIPQPPYRERGGNGVLLTWNYRVIALYTIEAEPFLREHALCMYSMLPAMKDITVEQLEQALEEMKQHYSTQEMEHHLTLFWRMLQKSRTLTRQQKSHMEEVIEMEFNWWIDTNPAIKKRIARAAKKAAKEAAKEATEAAKEAAKEAKIEGKIEGEVEALHRAILNVVQVRFPSQLQLAQQQLNAITQPAQLQQIHLDVVTAKDEEAAIHLFMMLEQNQATK